MKKNFFLLVFALVCLVGKGIAQTQVLPCGEDQIRQQILLKHPELIQMEANYEAQLKQGLKNIDYSKMTMRTTEGDSSGDQGFWYDVPIVVHVINDYGVEYLSDDSIYNDVKDWNTVYAKQNFDTALVIATYAGNIPGTPVRYIGDAHIRLHLAALDPNGNPSKGITRHRSYLTYIGGEVSKFDDWPSTSYVNIWIVNSMSQGNEEAAAYAFEPPEAALIPDGDGVICLYDYLHNAYTGYPAVSKTVNHEMGHVFNLYHPWGNTNNPQVALGDDGVDDTPPTWGHDNGGCNYDASSDDNGLYDTMFATNYYVIYTNISGGDSLVNYPDTTNVQNIMDYAYCARMFTYGQVQRMHAALNNPLAGRNNLWSDTNLMYTGILNPDLTFAPVPDLKPTPAFSAVPVGGSTSIANYTERMNYFTIPGKPIEFINETWNDTLTSLTWTFSNGASNPSTTFTSFSTNPTVVNTFTDGGWVTMSMQATGNHTGDTTVTWPNAVFVASATATPAAGYVQDFNPSGDVANWPSFNYYNNEFKWQLNDSFGYYDNYSIEYLGYDSRIIPLDGIYPYTGSPSGDFDDFFSIPFDLSAYSSSGCFLNFFTSAASRSNAFNITDTLEIDYMTSAGTWNKITTLSGGNLINKGVVVTNYEPSSNNDWKPNGISIPAAAVTTYTLFRFRYRPGVGADGYSSGNNFFMDNIHISEWPAAVENVKTNNMDVELMPNPTNGDAYVIVNDNANTSAQVQVMDVTGKALFAMSKQISGSVARIQIPHSAISVPGVYMVQVTTGSQVTTKKLVVY